MGLVYSGSLKYVKWLNVRLTLNLPSMTITVHGAVQTLQNILRMGWILCRTDGASYNSGIVCLLFMVFFDIEVDKNYRYTVLIGQSENDTLSCLYNISKVGVDHSFANYKSLFRYHLL